MKNDVYEIIRGYVKKNHGWDGDELVKSKEYKAYMEFQEKMKQFDGKRVKISFTASMDIMGNISGMKTGRIRVDGDRIKFYEGRKTRRHYHLDGGLYDGWFATLIPIEIVEL